jgi:hypothetical protein
MFYCRFGAGSGCMMRLDGNGCVLLYLWCEERMYNACGGERKCFIVYGCGERMPNACGGEQIC